MYRKETKVEEAMRLGEWSPNVNFSLYFSNMHDYLVRLTEEKPFPPTLPKYVYHSPLFAALIPYTMHPHHTHSIYIRYGYLIVCCRSQKRNNKRNKKEVVHIEGMDMDFPPLRFDGLFVMGTVKYGSGKGIKFGGGYSRVDVCSGISVNISSEIRVGK
jgi:hypothetical protein